MSMSSSNSSMDWDKLKVFHAAAEAGSFTHAGERLGLSQSAVSRQVSALEGELSVSLFHRHARGLILTEQGELLYRTAHEVFMKLEAARTKLTDSRERPNGELKVSTTPGIGVHWLTPRLGEFLDQPPASIDITADLAGGVDRNACLIEHGWSRGDTVIESHGACGPSAAACPMSPSPISGRRTSV